MAPSVVSVNVGEPREVSYRGRSVLTAIWKEPVRGRVLLRGINLDGDRQADLRVHGGPDKAVYAYAVEDLRWWSEELDRPLDAGAFGENLTIEGIDPRSALIGEHWAVGSAVLEVAQPRSPCFKLGIRMGGQAFVRQFARAERPGAYLRVVDEGDIGTGDQIRVTFRPSHGVTIGQVNHAYLVDDSLAEGLLEAVELPPEILAWARAKVRAKATGHSS